MTSPGGPPQGAGSFSGSGGAPGYASTQTTQATQATSSANGGLGGEVHTLERAIYEVKRIIVGQDQLVERILVGLLAKGHVLLEGVPGVAKTLAVETFAKVVGVVTDDGRTALLVVDALDRIDLHKAREALQAGHVRLLTEDELAALTPGCDAGAVPAIGELFGLPMHVDHAIREDAEISFAAGSHRFSVRVDRPAWERAAAVEYADLAADEDGRPAWARS